MSELVEPAPRGVSVAMRALASIPESIEGRGSWIAAAVTLGILSVTYGSPLLAIVALKSITEDLDTTRSMVSLAIALTWVGTGAGGIVMGWLADRLGIGFTVALGAVMIAVGLAVSAAGGAWALLLSHALLVGFLGNGALYPPLIVYVSRWFDRRRGTALALISSGQYIAGMVWPTVFEQFMGVYGWRATMIGFGVFVALIIPPIALLCLKRAPETPIPLGATGPASRPLVLGLRPNTLLALIASAAFLCCVPMAIPPAHLVAFCSDIGIPAVRGAAMLSVLQAAAFCSRMFWGWLSDRIGGLPTVLAASACQALAVAAFTLTQDEAGLFMISAAYGLGFSGIIPAYLVAIRAYYPSREASWRVPILLFVGMSGMAFGSWFAGALYDHFGFYGPAFVAGALFNVVNLGIVGFLVARQYLTHHRLQPSLAA